MKNRSLVSHYQKKRKMISAWSIQKDSLKRLAKEVKRATTLDIDSLEIKIPKMEFPKIQIPGVEAAYDNLETLTNNNSKYGWTLTNEIDINTYLDEDLLDKNQEYIDEVFTNYFEANSRENLHRTVHEIEKHIDDKWTSVVHDCFNLYETNEFRVIIPMLTSIVEGEIAKIAESDNFGSVLIKDWKKQIEPTSKDRFALIASYSLNNFLLSNVFTYKGFNEERGTILKRNWVMHGRDKPEEWTRTDALRLISNISTLQMVQN